MQLLEKLNTDTAEWQKGGPSVDSRVGRSSLGHQHCCDSAQMSPIRWHSMSNTAFLLNLAKTEVLVKNKTKTCSSHNLPHFRKLYCQPPSHSGHKCSSLPWLGSIPYSPYQQILLISPPTPLLPPSTITLVPSPFFRTLMSFLTGPLISTPALL